MGNNQSGEKAYNIELNDKNKLGEGMYGAVYRVKTNDKEKKLCAAKFFKVPYKSMSML